MMLDRGSCSSLCGSTFSRSQTRLDEFETWRVSVCMNFSVDSQLAPQHQGLGLRAACLVFAT
jgi:hypothetical protein